MKSAVKPPFSFLCRTCITMTMKMDVLETLALLGKALGSGHRLALLERLSQSEASVETLASTAELTIGNASAHLQQLRRAGLVTATRSGKQVFYRLTDQRIVTLLGLMSDVAETNLAQMERLVGRLFGDDDPAGALDVVSRIELLAGLESGAMVVLDLRSEEEFRAGHLPDAINLTLSQLTQKLDALPRDREIVAYCRGRYCVLSHKAVQQLRHAGLRVRRFEEGFPDWKAAGLPVHCESV
jgi:ArsR family transcriptional regulator